jgi:gamma-glutamylcyclotransferase (GGCT)/AIG2-like uncharacterized protein YtfP
MNNLVFVYGTLKKGEGNSYILKEAEFLGEACLVDKMQMKQLGFPAVFDGNKSGIVMGHLFKVDSEETWKRLDRLENNGVMYERQLRPVNVADATVDTEAWVYLAAPDFQERIKNYPDILPNDKGELIWT